MLRGHPRAWILAVVAAATGFFATAFAAAAAEPAPTPLAVARQEAESNVKTPAGRTYEGVVIGRVDDWLRPAVARCIKDLPAEELISFDVFVRVGGGGKAEEALFSPDTAVARCVAPEFRSAKYPSPPMPSWWVKVEVRIKP
ncbi:MAG: hypothetical protein WAU32_03965 [Thermoanaerobaculia bacterium]